MGHTHSCGKTVFAYTTKNFGNHFMFGKWKWLIYMIDFFQYKIDWLLYHQTEHVELVVFSTLRNFYSFMKIFKFSNCSVVIADSFIPLEYLIFGNYFFVDKRLVKLNNFWRIMKVRALHKCASEFWMMWSLYGNMWHLFQRIAERVHIRRSRKISALHEDLRLWLWKLWILSDYSQISLVVFHINIKVSHYHCFQIWDQPHIKVENGSSSSLKW